MFSQRLYLTFGRVGDTSVTYVRNGLKLSSVPIEAAGTSTDGDFFREFLATHLG